MHLNPEPLIKCSGVCFNIESVRNNTSFSLEGTEAGMHLGIVGVFLTADAQGGWSGGFEPETGFVIARARFHLEY